MTTFNLGNLAVTAVMGISLLATGAMAQGRRNAASQQTAAHKTSNRLIVISLQDRKLALLEAGRVVKVFPVAVGKPSTPSPEGTFTIKNHVVNPVYQHHGVTIPPGPNNPVGNRWMGLSIRGYGIHGTNRPHSIGKAASHGCIRMGKSDVEELFRMVRVGDKVQIIGQRNQETASLFGGAPTFAPQPLLVRATTPATHSISPAAISRVIASGLALAGAW